MCAQYLNVKEHRRAIDITVDMSDHDRKTYFVRLQQERQCREDVVHEQQWMLLSAMILAIGYL